MELELGPGKDGPSRPGYKTLDIDPNYHPDIVADAKDLSMIEDNSVDILFAAHLLEHMGHWYEITGILKEWCRVVKPGGYAEIYMPDLNYIIDCYQTGKWKEEVANPNFNFPHGAGINREKWINFKLYSSANPYDTHLCCLSFDLLKEYALKAGFSRVEEILGIKISLGAKLWK